MRRAALALLYVLVPSIAAAQAPPSKTLERAIKLYDRQDFFSASIELKKVVDGESGDTPDNVERARFFMAKTFFQLKFHVPAYTSFDQIIRANGTYRTISFKWIAGLRRVLPDAYLVPGLDSLTMADLDDPSLAGSRDELLAIRKGKAPASSVGAAARDALGCTQPDLARMREVVVKLRGYDDNVELVAATRLALRQNDTYAQTIDLAMTMVPAVRDSRRWVGELRDELQLLNASDRAWQTTQIAAELLQEITVQHAVGEADLGARLRELFDAMPSEIAALGTYQTPRERCTRDAPALAQAPLAASTSPMVVQPKTHGCGCASGRADASALVVLLAFALRRKSRAASGTRSPPA